MKTTHSINNFYANYPSFVIFPENIDVIFE